MVGLFSTADNTVLTDKQRLQRSESMLEQLYREDVSPEFHVPAMRGIKLMAALSVISILLFTGTMFYKFNAFILLREDVNATRGNIEAAIQRRTNLFGNMINLTLNHASLEHAVFSYAAKMRTQIASDNPRSPGGEKEILAQAEALAKKSGVGLPGGWEKALKDLMGAGGTGESLGRLLAVVEKYPDVKSSQTYQHMMTSLVNMEDLIATRRREHTEALRMYNMTISKFPWKLLAHWTDFQRLEYFDTANPGKGSPLITDDTYSKLMPFLDSGKGAKH
jgi:LemA protein